MDSNKTYSKSNVFIIIYLVFIAGVMLLPFLWMLSASLKLDKEVFTLPIQWIPKNPRLAN